VQEIKLDDLDAVKAIVEAVKDLAPRDQQRVFRWAAEKLGLPASRGEVDEPAAGADARPRALSGGVDIRTFVDRKNPASDVQFAAVVAYFYRFEAAEGERQDSVSAADLQEAARKAGRRRFGNPRQTLWNAVSVGVLDNAGRGQFRINTVGENLVAMTLPRSANGGPPAPQPPKRARPRPGRTARGAGRKAKKA
ncbi:MAG: hypothetical protein ACRD2F_10575, partial [Terriglobales bacterium]